MVDPIQFTRMAPVVCRFLNLKITGTTVDEVIQLILAELQLLSSCKNPSGYQGAGNTREISFVVKQDDLPSSHPDYDCVTIEKALSENP